MELAAKVRARSNELRSDQTMDTGHWASVGRMRAPNMFATAVQTNKTSPTKYENKKLELLSAAPRAALSLLILDRQTLPRTFITRYRPLYARSA